MANSYTGGLHLNQWAATDNFLRTEFNEDNRILDAAVSDLRDRETLVERLVERLVEPTSYNTYRLLLENEYEGKYVDFKKAMALDSFRDTTRIGAMASGVWYDPAAHLVRMLAVGTGIIDTGFAAPVGANTDGNDSQFIAVNHTTNYFVTRDFSTTGYGRLTSMTLRLATNYGTPMAGARVEILDGQTVLASSDNTVTPTSTLAADFVFTFSGGVALAGMHTYIIKIINPTVQLLRVAISSEPNLYTLGAILDITPVPYQAGTLTAKAVDLGQNYGKALAWVRHTGTVTLSLKGNSGGSYAMSKVSTRQTVNDKGEPCSETAFELRNMPPAPNNLLTAVLGLDASATGCSIFDYGVAVL